MYCWGRNGHGHFGNGMPESFTSDTAPVLGAHGRTFKALTVGGHSQTCGVNAEDDIVYCFGHNDFNQIGRDPRSGDDTAVAPVEGEPRGRAVATTEFRSCLISLDGQPMCWGDRAATPTLAPAPEPMTSVELGGSQACGFGESRTLYCWGFSTPTPVTSDVEFEAVFPGAFATCAVTAEGALYCWGDFQPHWNSARLGDARHAPIRILPEFRFKSVAIHVGRTCGVTTDGELYCWQ
jgi:alpha-tubulin suppressor-like RCC1 family protein